jgi:hypothetical protein
MAEGVLRRECLESLQFFPHRQLASHEKLILAASLDAVFEGESDRTIACKENVLALVHDFACERYWISDVLNRGDGTAPESCAVHNAGVKLDLTDGIQMGALSGVKSMVVFKNTDRCLDGIDCGTAILESVPSGFECVCTSFAMRFDEVIGDLPCTAVHDQSLHENNAIVMKNCQKVSKKGGRSNGWTEDRDFLQFSSTATARLTKSTTPRSLTSTRTMSPSEMLPSRIL